jgi:hypothetical protein
MTIPASTLKTLRQLGYAVRAERGDVLVEGPPPASPEAFLTWLKASKPALLAMLEAESRGDSVLVLDFTRGGGRHV